jgi:ankyrin repeat protein
MSDDVTMAEALVHAGDNINYSNGFGDCPFTYAVNTGKAKLVAFLLQRRVRAPQNFNSTLEIQSLRPCGNGISNVPILYHYFT